MITIRHISNEFARDPYQDGGDWTIDENGNVEILVSGEMGDPFLDDESFLLALHELIEAKLCHKRGVSEQSVVDFDREFNDENNSGDSPDSPYHNEHKAASDLEVRMAIYLELPNYGMS